MLPVAALLLVLASMLGELWLSTRNERRLLARGAYRPPDPVFPVMRVAYPGVFIAMAAEGLLYETEPNWATWVGLLVFGAAKLFKYWAIATLGERWTYSVLVLRGAPLVTGGPYRLMRHPNYVGVLGELVAVALMTGARWTGPLGTLFFSWLMWRRIVAEERALRLR